MDRARRYARTTSLSAFRVRTARQWAGRGRRGARWVDHPDGALLTTLAIRRSGDWDPRDANPGILALRIGVAVRETVAHTQAVLATRDQSPSEHIAIKWPNDILRAGAKCAGILVEADREWYYVGIGINLLPPVLHDSAAGARAGLPPVGILDPTHGAGPAASILAHLDAALERALRSETWWNDVDRHLAWRGESVVIAVGTETVSGRLVGLATNGAVRIDTDRGVREFVSGTLRRAR